jgi:serine/threonine-protein kinase
VIAFEMLTRRLPFEGPSAMAIAIQHVQAKPPAPSTYVDLHPALDELVLRLLAKTAAQRPASAEAVRRELKALSRQLADGATRLEPSPLGNMPSDQIPSVPTDHPITGSRQALRKAPPPPDSVTATRTDPSGPQRPGSQPRLAPITTTDMANPEPRHAPTTERVSAVRPSRVPQLVVGALLALVLVGGGLWALLREDSAEVQPSAVGETTSDPGAAQPIKPKPPPVDVKPPERSKPPTDETSAAALAQQGNGTNPATTKKPDEQPAEPAVSAANEKGTLHLIIKGWAFVYVNGKKQGRVPPMNKLELLPGPYKVELQNPGAKPYVINVTIKPGRTTEHVVKFEPKASAPTEAP